MSTKQGIIFRNYGQHDDITIFCFLVATNKPLSGKVVYISPITVGHFDSMKKIDNYYFSCGPHVFVAHSFFHSFIDGSADEQL